MTFSDYRGQQRHEPPNEFLETHHAPLAERVVGTLTRDIEALTDGQLVKEAREFFAL